MKRLIVCLSVAWAVAAVPAVAQENAPSPLPEPASVRQAQQKLQDLAPTPAQSEALVELLWRYLPRMMDEHLDPVNLAREIGPQAEGLLRSDQVQVLRQLQEEMGPLQPGVTSREERRRLIQSGLERLSHPDTREWLKRLESFEL